MNKMLDNQVFFPIHNIKIDQLLIIMVCPQREVTLPPLRKG